MKAQVLAVDSSKVKETIGRLNADSRVEYAVAMGSEPTALLTPITITPPVSKLTPEQRTRLGRIKKDLPAKDVQLARLEDKRYEIDLLIHAFDKQGTVAVPLTGGEMVKSSRKSVRVQKHNELTWVGELTGANGDAVIVVGREGITGSVMRDREQYSIRPLGGGMHAIIRLDPKRFPPEHPPECKEMQKTRPKQQGKGKKLRFERDDARKLAASIDSCADETEEIDVLVAYTPSVAAARPDIEAAIELAREVTNKTYQDSMIDTKINVVKTMRIAYEDSGKTFKEILSEFRRSPKIKRAIGAASADVAILLTTAKQYRGLAASILANKSSDSFAVVWHESAIAPFYTFAHEIGHLMGARHDLKDDERLDPFPHGHGFVNGDKWRTVMGHDNSCNDCPRRGIWSNPLLKIDGDPAGVVDESDNARVLKETWRQIAQFRCRR
jgi:hypothetical protein